MNLIKTALQQMMQSVVILQMLKYTYNSLKQEFHACNPRSSQFKVIFSFNIEVDNQLPNFTR